MAGTFCFGFLRGQNGWKEYPIFNKIKIKKIR
jgi:hypothetical protein